ncbi:Fic family protein [Aerococcus tenax]|uniref:Fic family protein n=1 Tax=Aerococcus tenax TaxID=3078812 RepID=A0A5N1BKV8_9LACT|nr:Fic family protein [Aerococcus urinae]KAA9239970.1 Fic family protein [Aerococcus urinae]MDK6689725.1 Fic family protein [Aerococcus urinae]
MFTKDYLEDLLVRMAYHSSAIEGNTISLPETVSIIVENSLPNNSKSIREFYEIENHKQAFAYLLEALEDGQGLSVDLIKQTHALLTDRLQHDHGQFKSAQNAIVGAEFKTASPQETPILVAQWVDNTTYRLESKEDCLTVLADTHIIFERIHPFSDGNGRTGRMILLFLALKYLKLPVIISRDNRAEYMEYLANQDTDSLKAMLEKSYQYEKQRVTEFQ